MATNYERFCRALTPNTFEACVPFSFWRMKIYPNECAKSKANFNKIIGNKITANVPIFAAKSLKLQIII